MRSKETAYCVAGLAIISAIGLWLYNAHQSDLLLQQQVYNENSAVKTTVEEIQQEFSDNEVYAINKYEGKSIKLFGEVKSVEAGNPATIHFRTDSGDVKAYVPDQRKVSKLKREDMVELHCVNARGGWASILVDSCSSVQTVEPS